MAAPSRQQVVDQLAESSLLGADALQALLGSVPEDQQPKDGEALIRWLVKQKQITAFQGQQLYAGKGKALLLGNYVPDAILATIDGQTVVDWKGDATQLSPHKQLAHSVSQGGNRLGLVQWNGRLRSRTALLIPTKP